VVPKLYAPIERIPPAIRKPFAPDFTVAQVASARGHGRTVNSGYGWAYGGTGATDPHVSARDWVNTAHAALIDLLMLWIDAETYKNGDGTWSWPSVQWLLEAFAELDRLGVQSGMYTAPWFVSHYLGGSTAFSDRANWTAFYNEARDLFSLPLYGGWDYAGILGHQFSADGIDRSVFAGVLA
jgi:hypothetical protein